ncbi:hypothetical protein [Roseateles sp. BYS87W]|uniref:DUF2846 domain-containing protein n=1 Tax=Pelomonas baiyunensis TaxID=3299026 RepID=A0ABW7H196_9BURK
MPRSRVLFLSVALAGLAGCAGQPLVALPTPSPEARAEVLVYRESAFIAGGVSLAVGSPGGAFAALSNADYVVAGMAAGVREIFVQARSAEPTRVTVNLQPGARVCLRTSASPSTLAKVLVPVTLIATGYHFYLDEVPCPSADVLANYKRVPVTYAAP